MKRNPAASGRFYPAGETALRRQIETYMQGTGERKAIAVVAPHAGYDFSGRTAGAVFSEVKVPGTAIILGPNHWGAGSEFAIMSEGSWDMPLGEVKIDSEVGASLKKACDLLEEDAAAHANEHSLEVEVPFLQHVNPDVQIVPIALSSISERMLEELGKAIAETIKNAGKEILIVASTDMNHYESQSRTVEKDQLAIERVQALDPEGLLTTCGQHHISMCGVVPTAITIQACKKLGAKKATLVKHATSGDVSGDYDAVVGYAAFVIE